MGMTFWGLRDTLNSRVPTGLSIALFKGTRPGLDGWQNRIGRFLDCGPYSHCELIYSDGLSASSSWSDGGVRQKVILYSSVGNWDFLPIPDPSGQIEARARRWFDAHMDCDYDVWGNVRFACGLARDSADKWFCSEAVMAALGFQEAYRFGPSGMVKIVEWLYSARLVKVTP